jgi:hypothetical protein
VRQSLGASFLAIGLAAGSVACPARSVVVPGGRVAARARVADVPLPEGAPGPMPGPLKKLNSSGSSRRFGAERVPDRAPPELLRTAQAVQRHLVHGLR